MSVTTITRYSPVQDVHLGRSNKLRIWPLYTLAFIEVFTSTLFGIALPNMLIFSGQISAVYLGISSFVNAFAFVLGPILLRPLIRNLGARKALMIVSFIGFLMIFMEVVFFHPVLLMIFSVIDGLFTSTLFWATIESEISVWEKSASFGNKSTYFRRYGLSWNIGAILAELVGLLLTRFGFSDFTAMWLSIVSALIQLPITFYFTQRGIKTSKWKELNTNNEISLQKTKRLTKSKTHNHSTIHRSIYYSVPILIGLIGEYIYQSVKTTFNFMYPFYLAEGDNGSYWTYLAILGQQICQIIAISWMSRIRGVNRYVIFMGALVATAAMIAITHMFPEQMMLTTIIAIGMTSGIIYSYSAQLILHSGKAEDSINNSTIYQTISALGFGIAPMITGFMVEIDMNLVYQFLFFSVILGFFTIAALKLFPTMNCQMCPLPDKELRIQTNLRDYFLLPEIVSEEEQILPMAMDPMVFGLGPLNFRSLAALGVP